jgi:WD40 repeat protein/tRNA A-37 threonylcarbamoyl transferase component Bud32
MSQNGPGNGDASAPVPSAPTEAMPEGLLAPGQVLGDRYQIRSQLGRGGMGEVWRAFDLKLRVEVALKALREDLFKDEGSLELLRREVRAAREVVSPNVCRIFDLIEVEGRELVSMEYIDGGTLLGALQERGPLDLKEAQDIASQFLAGLEAIHQAGLVHRDVKPENIMITRAGRVVLMDFGLAKQEDSGAGTVSGTPAYMAAEMVSPEGIKSFESRQSVWEGIRQEPSRVPDSPWAPVLKKAVAKEADQRYNSAHTLTRALEDVTLRVEGAEDLTPYPGLAAFTEDDAEYFFGREAEVEAMWAKLERPHLMALIGPSGAGKSSFLRAGLVPAQPPGWAHIICTPETAPLASLRRAVISELEGDTEALRELAVGDEHATVSAISRWRRRYEHTLIVVDQFEELFTLNSPEEQKGFAELLSRLALEADAHVVLSMRDDFFFHCHSFEVLAPLQDGLTMLGPPVGAALRRALVQPAMKCGYRFEDEELVDEMLAEVEGERGALPLVAFAAARLWEQRDRDQGLLTRQAYRDIGGVGGALARHAEATLERVGIEHIPIVRELFRNLVTGEGTRAVREWDELLSVFDPGDLKSESAEEVLRELIDARLLTSYEVREEGQKPTRRVEIIHESLLASWPRLVGWQTQDADSARLRDELRQAARTWDEHDRPNDRLWSGSAYREFASWRERYPGGLTEIEEAFGQAMTRHAERRRRRRRMAVAAVLAIAAVVTVVTTALWRRSVLHERRAEAQKLIALGTVEKETYPTAALVYAAQSLELADSNEARLLALEALWEGPTAFIVNEDTDDHLSFSPGGTWFVQTPTRQSEFEEGDLVIVSRNGEQRVVALPAGSGYDVSTMFGAAEDYFITEASRFSETGHLIALWSAPEGQVVASARPTGESEQLKGKAIFSDAEGTVALFTRRSGELVQVETLRPDGRHERLGAIRIVIPAGEFGGVCVPPMTGEWLGLVEGNEVSIVRVGRDGLSEKRLLGRHEGNLFSWCDPDPLGRFLVTVTRSGQIKLWDAAGDRAPATADDMRGLFYSHVSRDGSHFFAVDSPPRENLADAWIWSVDDFRLRLRRRFERVEEKRWPDFDPVGLRLAMAGPVQATRLWSLTAPAAADPILLRRGKGTGAGYPFFSPDGRWLATSGVGGVTLWPLVRRNPAVIRLELNRFIGGMELGPEGLFVATAADAKVSVFPLDGPVPPEGRTVYEANNTLRLFDLAISPDGELFATCGSFGQVWIGRDDGGGAQLLEGVGGAFVDFSPDGRLLALMDFPENTPAQAVVWDVENARRVAVLRLDDAEMRLDPIFISDGRLLTGTSKGVVAWDVENGDHEVIIELDVYGFWPTDDGQRLLVTEAGEGGFFGDPEGSPLFYDFDSGVAMRLESHGTRVWAGALNRDGTVVVTGDRDGIIRVGPVTGEEPHLLLGNEGPVAHLEIDPLGRWIASAGGDHTIRIWPMPDLSKPPLHTLPRAHLIARLKNLTNIRAVRDPESSTGWKLTHVPFQGWETVPTW